METDIICISIKQSNQIALFYGQLPNDLMSKSVSEPIRQMFDQEDTDSKTRKQKAS